MEEKIVNWIPSLIIFSILELFFLIIFGWILLSTNYTLDVVLILLAFFTIVAAVLTPLLKVRLDMYAEWYDRNKPLETDTDHNNQ